MQIFVEILIGLWNVWKEMFGVIFANVPRLLSISLWGLLAVLILPCVFVANIFYPKWVEWGEDL